MVVCTRLKSLTHKLPLPLSRLDLRGRRAASAGSNPSSRYARRAFMRTAIVFRTIPGVANFFSQQGAHAYLLCRHHKTSATVDSPSAQSVKQSAAEPHIPVLLNEVLGFFEDNNIDTLVDGTLGAGIAQHSLAWSNVNGTVTTIFNKVYHRLSNKILDNSQREALYSSSIPCIVAVLHLQADTLQLCWANILRFNNFGVLMSIQKLMRLRRQSCSQPKKSTAGILR